MQPLPTIGLCGDGDEIWAIEAAFTALGVAVPVEDAANWFTVGDLRDSALKIVSDVGDDPENWNKFRIALSDEIVVDWTVLRKATTLLDGRGHKKISRLFTSLRERMKKALENA